MSLKAYKYRLYANTATTEQLHWVLDRCRELYYAVQDERTGGTYTLERR